MASVDTDPRLGTDLAGYRIESVLGRGGMGVVYLATDLRLKRRVALKLVAPELAADPLFRERFLREAELAASLDHSHVVPVYAAGELNGQLWIAMRYVQGTDLRTLLEAEGPLEPARALELVAQVGEALDGAHEHGLVHRDVKPANVLVTEEGGEEHCYLSDFGLARSPSDEQVAVGAHLSGTIDYTAPEQSAHEPLDHRADVYSLGCVLYECLTGQPPFKRPRPAATLFAHANDPPPSAHAARPELPEAIDPVIDKALAKNPRDRHATCGELVAAARGALGVASPGFARRRVLAAAGAALVLVVAAAVLAILLATGHATPAESAPAVPLPLTKDSLVRIDPATGRLMEAVPVEGAHILAVDADAVWVASGTEPTLSRIDPRSNTVVDKVDTSELGVPGFLAAGEHAVWVGRASVDAQFRDGRLWRYDSRSGPLAAVPAEIFPGGVATGAGSVWIVSGTSISRVDADRGQILWSADLRDAGRCDCVPGELAIGEGAVWAIGGGDSPDTVFRVDLRTREITMVPLGAPATDIAVGGGSVWVTDLDDDAVTRINPATNRVAGPIRVGRIPSSVAVGQRYVWVASSRDGTVTRVDPATSDITTIDVGGTPEDIAVGEGAVWVTVNVR